MFYFKYFVSRIELDGSKMREKWILFFLFYWVVGKYFVVNFLEGFNI